MKPMGKRALLAGGALASAIVLGASVNAVLAQATPNSGELTHGLTNPKNGGVAGTGMGSTDPSTRAGGGAAGTGMSVEGPPGQGITGPETRGLDTGDGSAPKPAAR